MVKHLWSTVRAVAITLPLAGCGSLGFTLVNALAPESSFQVSRDLAYGAYERQRLDVYTPTPAQEARPVVVFFYGGRWSGGSKQDYLFVAEALAAKGMVVVVPDYRVYPQVRFPAFVEDAAEAVAWVHRHVAEYGGDPQDLFVMGHSAGAHIAALLALDERYLKAVGGSPAWLDGMIGLAGPYDFLPLTADDLKAIFGPPAKYPVSQPINFVDDQHPPLLLLHGGDDSTVKPANTTSLAEKVREEGGSVRTVIYDKLSHVSLVGALSRPFRFLAPVLEEVVGFVRRHSDQEAAL
jgi:acetyl esterase/lipase